MWISNMKVLIIVFCCVTISAQRHSLFVKGRHCPLDKVPSRLILRTELVSNIDCVRRCTCHALCQFTRSMSDADSKPWCELFHANVSETQLPEYGHDTSLPDSATRACYVSTDFNVSSLVGNVTLSNHRGTNNTSVSRHLSPIPNCCENEDDPELQTGTSVAVIDTDDPKTLTKAYMGPLDERTLSSKVVFRDGLGVYHAVAIYGVNFLLSSYKGSLVYAMEKDENGFQNNASRITYTCVPKSAQVHKGYIYQNGDTELQSETVPKMRVFIRNGSEYSLMADASKENVQTVVEWIKQGFKILKYSYSTLADDESVFSVFYINKHIKQSQVGLPAIPLTYIQRTQRWPKFKQAIHSAIGIAQNVDKIALFNPSPLYASPLWQSLSEDSLTTPTSTLLTRQMFCGHAFRVSVNKSYFDVDDVLKVGEEVYFLLPQQASTNHNIKFNAKSVGTRAVLSSGGRFSWCSHPLEGEEVLHSGRQTGQGLQYFVDKKRWTTVFSVYSNGSAAFGSASDIAEQSLEEGRDVNILIEWLKEDRARLLTTCMVSVVDYDLPEVLVTAESRVSWNLNEATDGGMEVNQKCDLEKVLVQSNGNVQVLVYNVHTRHSVVTLTDVKVSWFTY